MFTKAKKLIEIESFKSVTQNQPVFAIINRITLGVSPQGETSMNIEVTYESTIPSLKDQPVQCTSTVQIISKDLEGVEEVVLATGTFTIYLFKEDKYVPLVESKMLKIKKLIKDIIDETESREIILCTV